MPSAVKLYTVFSRLIVGNCSGWQEIVKLQEEYIKNKTLKCVDQLEQFFFNSWHASLKMVP